MHKKQRLVYIFRQKMCKMDFMTSVTETDEVRSVQEQSFYVTELSWYKFNLVS